MSGEVITQGQVSISRMSGDGEDCVAIRVTDSTSGCRLVDIHLPFDEYATATLSGVGRGKAIVHVNSPVGYKSESKDINVTLPDNADGADIRKAVLAHEVDGWRGYDKDAANHHRRTPRSNEYRVRYHRWVHPETGEVWKD